MPCPPASRALRRPRPPCGLSLRAAGFARLQFCLHSAGRADIGSEPARAVPAASPCARPRPPRGLTQRAAGSARRQFLPALRGKGGYWQGASACRARRVTLRAHPHFQRSPILARRPHPLRSPIPACRRFFPALRRPRPRAAYPCAPRVLPASSFCLRSAGRADIGSEPARAVPAASPCARPPASPVRPTPARRMPCPPASRALRRPRSPCGLSLRPPASPVRPIPAHRGFCPSAAGRADIGREPAHALPAASPCAPARVLRAA